MGKKNSIAATAADFQSLLNNKLRLTVRQAVFDHIEKRKDSCAFSAFDRELIAEEAWGQVIAKRESYSPGKGSFSTWAKTVGVNKAKDVSAKHHHDAYHHIDVAPAEEEPENEYDAKKYEDKVSYQNAYGHVEDCSRRQYWRDMHEALKHIVSGYCGRDREVAEMLIEERTKEEIMAKTHMSGGNVDVCKSRVLKRMRADLLKAGYSLAA